MGRVYCSICGKDIEKCTCRKSEKIETKVEQPKEIKQTPKVETKPSK
jgi:uncharacterized Zn finger protein (UPF0148 family)